MVKSLPARSAVPVEETWDLSSLFSSSEEFDQALESLEQDADALSKKAQGTIVDASSAIQVLTDYVAFLEKLVPLSTYASLTISTDQTNNEVPLQSSKFGAAAAKISSKLSFINSELLELPKETLEQAMQESEEFHVFLEKLLRRKPHQLHPEVEKSLAAYSSTFSAPYGLYNTTKMVDMNFEDFEVNGQTYPLSYVSFEGDWEAEPNTELRRAAFEAFSNKLKDYQHTTAKTYDMQLQMEKTTADLRGYDSIFDYLLFNQEVDRSLYNRQIDLITKELAPHMQKYAKLLQKAHGLDHMTFADLKISLDPSYEPEITVEESKKYIDDALSIMGTDYIEMVDRSYSERWIDFAQNKGKSTGAFCSSPYGNHPYILISWTGRMNEVFVLAHELGHAGHFYNANREQNVLNARPSLYFIEAPSTMNEMLVANHLLKSSGDPKFKRWVISSIVARTYYHNFVTHLLEAAYQRKVYERIDAGQSVNAGILNDIKRGVLEEFWGDAVDITDGAELTWMRQPHYYMGLYPYTYSAGLTISTQVSKRILNEGQPAVEEWLEVLKAGGTKTPVELAQMAGVDITTEQPLRDTVAYIGELVDELERLTEEIEKE
ncbi:oligoendopeptidase F [Microbacterium sp. APC 3898]|uniref:Oligopeptidase F n=1 Tax=Planococcus notacanthi TaxID=3035188 RepID=A0ABT7ZLT4_9BACL|nr:MULTISPECIES: oligoendopeptidase F [Terrabacteria group]MDN3428078.1 oligoendopeptidase F [Planococcus sp. APC 4016]MDN3498387.1 oligoendopeptidase F [Microbacterium sp. APC 3898]